MSIFNRFLGSPMSLAKLLATGLLLLCVSKGKLNAQQVSNNGDFRLTHTVGCAPFTVTPEVLFPGTFGSVQYFYFNESDPLDCPFNFNQDPGQCVSHPDSLTSASSYTFHDPGKYYIVQILGTNPTPRVDFIEVTVVEDRAPFIGISVCDNNTALLIFDFDGDFFDFYDINFGDGNTRQLLKTEDHRVTHVYAAPGTYTIRAQGRLSSGDNLTCQLIREEQITTIDQIPMPILDSLIVQSQDEIALYFQELNERLVYNLEIDRGSGFEFFLPIPPQTNPRSFEFRDFNLDNFSDSYRFRIEATDFCGSTSVYSDPIASIALDHSLASFDNGIEVELDWQTSSQGFNALDYYVNGTFQQSFNTPTNTAGFTVTFDNCTDLGRIYLEHVFNGQLSRSAERIPFEGQSLELPAISAPNGILDGFGINLSYPAPQFQVAEYQILRRDENGDFQEIGTSTDNTFRDTNVPTGFPQACYAIRYIDECGNTSEQSEQLCITVSGAIQVPNAFSPNGDNINDVFTVGEGIFQSFEMYIYNRWGTLVFQSGNPAIGWRGTFDGQPAPIGTYTYRITFANADNVPVTKTGTFVLIR